MNRASGLTRGLPMLPKDCQGESTRTSPFAVGTKRSAPRPEARVIPFPLALAFFILIYGYCLNAEQADSTPPTLAVARTRPEAGAVASIVKAPEPST